MNEREFWMVWNPDGRPPSVRHLSRISAVREAERLARSNPGECFYVLCAESVSMVEPKPSITRRLATVEFPF